MFRCLKPKIYWSENDLEMFGFSYVVRAQKHKSSMQAGRMDEQRAVLPPSPSAAAAATTPAAAGTAAAQ